jgi:hypothetical protein
VIVAFSPEEQVEAFGQSLTLRLDFRAISTIEGALDVQFPVAVAHARNSPPSYSILSRMLWACLREYNPEVTIDQALAIVMDKGADGMKVGAAFDALLERAFPITEDRKRENPPKRNGRSKSSAAVG